MADCGRTMIFQSVGASFQGEKLTAALSQEVTRSHRKIKEQVEVHFQTRSLKHCQYTLSVNAHKVVISQCR